MVEKACSAVHAVLRSYTWVWNASLWLLQQTPHFKAQKKKNENPKTSRNKTSQTSHQPVTVASGDSSPALNTWFSSKPVQGRSLWSHADRRTADSTGSSVSTLNVRTANAQHPIAPTTCDYPASLFRHNIKRRKTKTFRKQTAIAGQQCTYTEWVFITPSRKWKKHSKPVIISPLWSLHLNQYFTRKRKETRRVPKGHCVSRGRVTSADAERHRGGND